MKTSKVDFLRDLYLDWNERIAANPNMSIPDLRSLFDEWEKATLEPENVTYTSDEIAGINAIWAIPIGCDKSKVMIFTHGGGFAVGSSSSHRKLAGHVANTLNIPALVIDYRRTPEHPFPAQVEDTTEVYKELLTSGFKAKDIVMIGDSAGGNIAVASVLNFRELGFELPSCVIAFSPWLDMELCGSTIESNADTDALISPPIMKVMTGMFLGGDLSKATDPLANPLYADFKDFPPLYINASGAEVLLDDARRLYSRAKEYGVNVTLSVVDNMQHVFPFLAGREPEVDKELNRLSNWYENLPNNEA
jgi:epsilon-lactone hydrolase